MNKSAKGWSLLLFLLAGVVIGGFIGNYVGGLPYMGWLRFGDTFGMTSPAVIDLNIIKLQFAVSFTFNIAGVIGMLIGLLAYRKL